MSTGELIRSARLRAGLSQKELARAARHGLAARSPAGRPTPSSPALDSAPRAPSLRLRHLPVLVPFERDPERDARVQEVQELTPQERLQRLLSRLEKPPRR